MKVTRVRYWNDYQILVWFDVGGFRLCDIKPILKYSENPDIKELFDVELFKQFHIEHGGICWDNNALSLSAESLYNGDYFNTT